MNKWFKDFIVYYIFVFLLVDLLSYFITKNEGVVIFMTIAGLVMFFFIFMINEAY